MKWIIFLFLPILLLASPPPKEIPQDLYDAYTDGGTLDVIDFYIDETVQTAGKRYYSSEELNQLIEQAQRKEPNYYGHTDVWLYELLEERPTLISGKNVAIMGSVVPWYEAIVLAYGGIPWTIEYNPIETNDPRLHLTTVEEFSKNPQTFDIILSISSFEHDGLGRYGDRLDPYGDFKAMQKCLSMLNPGGKLILSVPVGRGALAWNAHRIYGRKRLTQLLEGWELLAFKGDYRKMFTFPKGDYWYQPILLLEPNPNLEGNFDKYINKAGLSVHH